VNSLQSYVGQNSLYHPLVLVTFRCCQSDFSDEKSVNSSADITELASTQLLRAGKLGPLRSKHSVSDAVAFIICLHMMTYVLIIPYDLFSGF